MRNIDRVRTSVMARLLAAFPDHGMSTGTNLRDASQIEHEVAEYDEKAGGHVRYVVTVDVTVSQVA